MRAGLLAAALALLAAATGPAAPAPPRLPAGLPAAERGALGPVAREATVSTRMEGEPFPVRPEVFEFLLDHPELATHVSRALKVARYRVWRTPEGLFLDDGWGASGRFALVWAAPGTRVMHARGRYEPRILPSILGEAVVVIEYGFRPAGGRPLARTAVTGFVRLESRFLAFLARLGSGIAQRKADREARSILKVFREVSQALEDDPAAVLERVRARPDVPRADLEAFARLLRGGPRDGPRPAEM